MNDVEPRQPLRRLMNPPISVDERLTLRSLAGVLSEADIGVALVRCPDGSAGIVSERDVVRALADGADPDEVWAADVMARPLVIAEADESVLGASVRMVDEGVRHIAVVDRGQIVGVVSARDALAVLTDELIQTL